MVKKRNLQKVVLVGTYHNIIEVIYNKPTANITLNDEKLKASPLRSGTQAACPLSPLSFNIGLEVLDLEIREKRKEINGTQIGGRGVKLSLFVYNMILYVENPKDAAR